MSASEYLAADPTLPAYGVDVRITDANGALIYARISGDGVDFAADDADARSAITPRTSWWPTGYGVTSTYSHNCNDDSHLEVIDVRHDWVYSTDDGSCHDFGANPDPDGCNPSTW